MTTYILLRSNKESGPFTIDQLREMGLRPSDLIWVEGQSASWRNPHEIKELKELAGEDSPAVISSGSAYGTGDQKQDKDQVQPANPSQQQKKSVFVAMPARPELSTKEDKPVSNEPVIPLAPQEKSAYQTVEERPKEEVQTKYAMSLDEIKERYLKSLEVRRKPRLHLRFKVPPALSRVAVYAGLVGLGAMIVLLLTRKDPVANMVSEQKRLPGVLQTRPGADGSDIAVDDADVVLPESYYDAQTSMGATERKEQTLTKGNSNRVQKNRSQKDEPDNIEENSEMMTEEDHSISIPRNETPVIKSPSPGDLAEKVSVKTNRYTIAALGGIRNLELTLRNDSRYMLDRVTVEVRFLSPNGNIVKTEDVHFSAIQPNGSQTIAMKKTTRGVKVIYKIIRIESKDVAGDTAGL